jgi:hypothetical protein
MKPAIVRAGSTYTPEAAESCDDVLVRIEASA